MKAGVAIETPTEDATRDKVEIFCYLACLGPGAFDVEKAVVLVDKASKPCREGLVRELLDPSRREETSREVGQALASLLAGHKNRSPWDLTALLPALVRVDLAQGFRVLKCLVAAAPDSLAQDFADIFVSMLVAEGKLFHSSEASTGMKELCRQRFRYVTQTLASLSLSSEQRTRVFMALVQSVSLTGVLDDLLAAGLYPASPEEGATVLRDGNEKVLTAMLAGAARRPQGIAEFYATCRTIARLESSYSIPLLAALLEKLETMDSPSARRLSSVVRATALLVVERLCASGKALQGALPPSLGLSGLNLLRLVAPGLSEPGRSELCDFVLSRMRELLKDLQISMEEVNTATKVLVDCTVIHRAPQSAGKEVREAFMLANAALAARKGGPERAEWVDHGPFLRLFGQVAAEFRRRNHLTNVLAPVLPILLASDQRPASQSIQP